MLENDRLRIPAKPRFVVALELLAGVDDDRQVAHRRITLYALEQVESVRAREAEVEHHAVILTATELFERLIRTRNCRDLHIIGADELDDRFALGFIVLVNQQSPYPLFINESIEPGECVVEFLARERLIDLGNRART